MPVRLELLLALCMFMWTFHHGIAAHNAVTRSERETQHHHCIHDAKLDEFEETVDKASLTVPQEFKRDVSIDNYQSTFFESFLDAVGVASTTKKQRSLKEAASSAATFQPIRIAFDLSKLSSDPGFMCTQENEIVNVDGSAFTCSSSDVATPAKIEFIKSVLLKSIKDWFGNILSVQQVVGNLVIAGISCTTSAVWACCTNSVPSTYKATGVANADFLLHVTARPTTGLVLAWALPCNIDQYGRPISGQANFGPARIDPTTPANRDSQIATALHEMTHALVFSSSRFADFRQPLNGNKWGYNNVVSQTTGAGIYVSKIITPNVVKQAKQHFNCYEWADAGFELENGPSGSASFSSHWEKRVAMNEYMTATSSYDAVYSAFTLALFEDSGWYQVSYATAQVLPWGYMEGCGMAKSRCSTWNDRYICKTASQQTCTPDYNAKGYCNVASYQSSIPAGFQYFEDTYFGGKDSYADYCPFYRAYSNGDCRGIGTVSTLADSTNRMEVVGLTSKCFSSNLNRNSGNSASFQASCFPVLGCTSTSLRLSIGSTEVLCPIAGGQISVSGYYGQIVCPVANKLCQMLQGTCSGNGILLATGVCSCNPGYVGANCNGTSCPQANGVECSGSDHGVCDYTTGNCACTSSYTGLSCSELVCPALSDKNTMECSGFGSCNRVNGSCSCNTGYSGKSCECVPGCSTTQCSGHGSCDCMSGGCSCDHGYSGVTCSNDTAPTVVLLTENNSSSTLNATVPSKGYSFYKIYMNSSAYDITFIVQYNNVSGIDVDLYGSFDDSLPTAMSANANLFSSVYSGPRDEINLCGTLGVFPRGLSDAFRYCPRSTSSYITGTPGYFYLSVFGYAGGAYSLSIETDKCRGVTCSNHGECGVDYPGICTCDRYWTGESCSVPKCGPDCIDLGSCTNSSALLSSDTSLGDYVTSVILAAKPLRNTSECYGNGVCQVLTDSKGNDVPTCVCDDPFSFSNPTPAQALCKELVPSVAYIEHFTEPFTITSNILELQVDVDDWALFTLAVKDEWQILVANLEIESTGTDAMLFIRKDKIPSVATSANSSSYVQYMDSSGWASGSSTRKIVLNRASSTLSSGLYYIGVYNSAYAYSSLSYTLTVNATANCTANSSSTLGDSFGVCSNNGSCSALSSTFCTCPSGFVGTYCDLKATRSVLSSANSSSSSSYVAFATPNETLLPVGEWVYYSFEVNDSNAHAVRFTLWIENDLSVATPVFPLLLVRGPNDDGFPTLFVDNMQDFQAISTNAANQTVSLAIETACSFATQQRDCYKIAVFNRAYSGSTLRYHVEVTVLTSKGSVYPLQTCGATGSAVNCYGRGTCIMMQDTSSTASSMIPSCTCTTGWMGMRCNSPTSFDLPQLWSSMSNISLLCSTCESQFTLARGEIKMFRIPESLRADTGLRIHVGSVSSSSSSTAPNVYVSETRPRSLYDFTHISTANTSSSEQSVALTNSSITGSFWVVVYNAYSTTGSSALTSSTMMSLASQVGVAQRRLQRDLSPQVRPGLRSLDCSKTTRVLTTDDSTFRLIVDVFSISGDSNPSLITSRSFIGEVVHWLLHTPIGLAVLACSALLLLFVLVFCMWRVCRAPDNQDRQTKRHFGQRSPAQVPVNVQLANVARGGALVHASDSQL